MQHRRAPSIPRVPLLALLVLVVAAFAPAPAGAIVGGTDHVSDALAAPLAFIEIKQPQGLAACTGTLISPSVVMTAAHCVYETTKHNNLIGIAAPSAISVRVGSRDVWTRRSGSALP